jgi:uncharacterized protein
MRIGVIGATGNLGLRVVAEAVGRGHQVRAFTRDLTTDSHRPDVEWAAIDVLDPGSVTAAIGGLDVLVSSYQPGNGAKDFDDVLRRSIKDPSGYVTAAKALLKGLNTYLSLDQVDRYWRGRKPRDRTRGGEGRPTRPDAGGPGKDRAPG